VVGVASVAGLVTELTTDPAVPVTDPTTLETGAAAAEVTVDAEDADAEGGVPVTAETVGVTSPSAEGGPSAAA
jgi:hypothetical protein